MSKLSFAIVAVSGMLAGTALGGVIHVSPIGGGIDITSGAGPAFGPGPGWGSGSVAAMHNALAASGINTDGKITFAAVDTDHGLAMITLIDRDFGGSSAGPTGQLHMDGVSDGLSQSFSTDPLFVSAPGGPTRFATGEFNWNSGGGGSGFGWGNLHSGSTLTWRFQKTNAALSLNEPATVQFVTWTGSNWSVVPLDASQTSFSGSGEFGFAANVVVPGPATLALLPLTSLVALRRRRGV